MEELVLKSTVKVAQMSELNDAERLLVEQAIAAIYCKSGSNG